MEGKLLKALPPTHTHITDTDKVDFLNYYYYFYLCKVHIQGCIVQKKIPGGLIA